MMNTEIERGRTILWLLLGAACLLFLVNVFNPLYLSSTDSSDRMMTFFVVAFSSVYALRGKVWARSVVVVMMLIATLLNVLVFFTALSSGQLLVALTIGMISLVFASVGWLLLTSKSVRAFEAASQSNA